MQRYFVLDSNGDSLYYFNSKKDRQNVNAMPEQIPISLVKTIDFDPTMDKGLCFSLTLMSGHIYALKAESPAMAQKWVGKITSLKTKNERDSRQSNEEAFAEEIAKEKEAARKEADRKAAATRAPKMRSHMRKASQRRQSTAAPSSKLPKPPSSRAGPPPGPPPRRKRSASMVKSSGRMARLRELKLKKQQALSAAEGGLAAVAEDGSAGGEGEIPPHGWTTDVDPGSGESYYYNIHTHETAWERPAVMDGDVAPASGGGGGGSAAAPAAAPACPAGWEAHLDPEGSGEHYYINMATGETTWDLPAADHAAASAAPPAPPGWEAHLDAESGAHYYVNVDTHETSWDYPGEEDATHVLAHADALAHAAPAEEGWSMHTDAESGHVFYVNDATGETKWAEP